MSRSMTARFVTCPRCGGKAFRNAHGKLLAHTTPARGGWRYERSIFDLIPTPKNTGPYVLSRVCE